MDVSRTPALDGEWAMRSSNYRQETMLMRSLSDIVTSYSSPDPINVTQEEALLLAKQATNKELYEAAHRVKRYCMGYLFDTCSIINVKSGLCSEDCHWCAQSRHYHTQAKSYPLLADSPCVSEAQANRRAGIGRIALVASGRGQNDREIERIAQLYEAMHNASDIKLCASLGLLTLDQLRRLHEVGVTTYHCNMETAPSYFPNLCTTHTQAEKEQTILYAREAGLQVCSGGIIGMGETMEQRMELACYLRSLGIRSIPINILHPIIGTPLARAPRLTDEEYLRTIALFRLINPTAFLRFSGGRLKLSPTVMRQAMYIGINSAITGDMLTTSGMQAHEDMQLITEMGYHNTNEYDWEADSSI